MTPERIGIHVPYTLDEATYMACGLADYAMRLGLPVTILSSQVHDPQVHYRWDREILSGKRHNFGEWASRCSHLVWFDVQKNKVTETARQGLKNILVVMPNRICKADVDLMGIFDAVVCAQRATYDILRKRFKDTAVYVPWDSGRPITTMPMRFGGRRIFVPLESKTADIMGPTIIHTLRVLLDRNDEIEVTFSHTRGFTRPAMVTLTNLAATHKKRVVLLKKPNYADLMEVYATHDWILALEVRANTGLSALEGLAAGRPVIAFDTPLFREFIKEGEQGILVPCEIKLDLFGLNNEVESNAYQIQESLMRLVTEPELYERMCREPWPELLERCYHFQQRWRELWDYDLPGEVV